MLPQTWQGMGLLCPGPLGMMSSVVHEGSPPYQVSTDTFNIVISYTCHTYTFNVPYVQGHVQNDSLWEVDGIILPAWGRGTEVGLENSPRVGTTTYAVLRC